MYLTSYLNKRQKINQATRIVVFPSFLHLSLQSCCFGAAFSGGLGRPATAQGLLAGSAQGGNSQLWGLSAVSSDPQQPHGARQAPLATTARSFQGKTYPGTALELEPHPETFSSNLKGNEWIFCLASLLALGRQRVAKFHFFRGKSPFIFSSCFQLPHLMMLHALCCWWGPGPHPMGMALIQGPKRALEHGQGGHHIPKTAQSQGEQGSPPSAPCELGWSL